MYTQCPECGTVFRVNAPVLRAAHGQVRCGVCGTAFDALRFLTEAPRNEGEAAATRTAREPGPRPRADEPPPLSAAAEEPSAPASAEDEMELEEPAGLAELKARVAAFQAQMKVPAAVIPPSPGSTPHASEEPAAEQPEESLELVEEPVAEDTQEPEPQEIELVGDEIRALDVDAMELDLELAESGEVEALPAEELWEPASATAQVWEGITAAEDEEELAPEVEADALELEPFEEVEVEDGDDSSEDAAVNEAEEASLAFDQGANVEHVVIGGELSDVPDTALEFDLPAEEWDRVFVPDAEASTLPPLDPALRSAQSEALAEPPAVQEPEEPEELEATVLEPEDDPLAITDEFPPLNVPADELPPSLAAELSAAAPPPPAPPTPASPRPVARAVPRAAPPPPPPAAPLTGEDFDALVANAAARAAGELKGTPVRREPAPPARAQPPAPVPPQPGSTPVRPPAANTATATPASASASASASPRAARRPPPAPAPPRPPPEEPAVTQDAVEPVAELAPVGFDVTHLRTIGGGASERQWPRALLIALFTILLGVQLTHYWRESLAGDPKLGPPLVRLYRAFGVTLEPHWDVSAYTVKQWGGAAEAQPGMLRLQASIVNTASKAQPYPMLRVTMLDRFGGKVARREFTPAEYLPGKHAPPGLLTANGRADADLALADPGQEAVGFELDVCLVQGVLRCAGERREAH